MNITRTGYKGFDEINGKLYCRDMEYKVGEVAEVEGAPIICDRGIHFCWNINDVDDYYSLRTSVICEVEPLGDIVAAPDGKKCCTNKLKVIRALTKEEVWKISNSGSCNTGYDNAGNYNTGDNNMGHLNTGNCNTGDSNTGCCNTGNFNTGYFNAGKRNVGSCNTGDSNTGNYNAGNTNTGNYNIGHCNTSDYNAGNFNTGNYNKGNFNSGEWNASDGNTGFFNTEEHDCYIFDKPSGMTQQEFRSSVYYLALCSVPLILTEWKSYTEAEQAMDKAKKLIGKYLKYYTYKEACANWWEALTTRAKETIKHIPNFDAEKFEKITGIKV